MLPRIGSQPIRIALIHGSVCRVVVLSQLFVVTRGIRTFESLPERYAEDLLRKKVLMLRAQPPKRRVKFA